MLSSAESWYWVGIEVVLVFWVVFRLVGGSSKGVGDVLDDLLRVGYVIVGGIANVVRFVVVVLELSF